MSQMNEEMLKFGLEEPQFLEGNNSFKAIFKSNNNGQTNVNDVDNAVNLKDLDLNQRQIDILTKITNEHMILSYENHNKIYDKSRANAERDFSILLQNDLIKKFVKNRKAYYSSIDY